jgi:Holliday junction resolvase
MTHPSKRKGNVFERELVNMARDSGIEAQRAYASNGESLGLHAEVDCLVGGYSIQAKRRKSIASFMQPTDDVDVVALRQDFGPTLIVLRYSDWLDLIKEENHVSNTQDPQHPAGPP